MLRITYRVALFATLTILGCGTEDGAPTQMPQEMPEPLPPAGDARVRFALQDGPLDFASVPFPSELYRDASGRIAIGQLPNPKSDAVMLTKVRELIGLRQGFCATCNATFAIDGGVDVASLPEQGAEPDRDDAIVLVDVDPDSPEHGRLFPLRAQYDATNGWLSVRPARGFALHGGRAYAAVVTANAIGGDGLPIGPADEFIAVRDGQGEGDARLMAASAALEPTFVELEAIGIPREQVVGLAAFTTEDPTADFLAMRETIRAADVPSVTVDAVLTGDAIDELLGVPG